MIRSATSHANLTQLFSGVSFHNMQCENVKNRYIKINGKTDKIGDRFSYGTRYQTRASGRVSERATAVNLRNTSLEKLSEIALLSTSIGGGVRDEDGHLFPSRLPPFFPSSSYPPPSLPPPHLGMTATFR